MRVAMSYSIFGDDVFYWDMIRSLIRMHMLLYKGFDLCLHCGDQNLRATEIGQGLLKLKEKNVPFINVIECFEPVELCIGMLWRMKPIWRQGYDYCFGRDVDSIPCGKDRVAIEEFINSGKTLHCINDHPQGHHLRIMGGLWGVKCDPFVKKMGFGIWEDIFQVYRDHWQNKGTDQNFLNNYCWGRCMGDAYLHRLQYWFGPEPGIVKREIDYSIEVPGVSKEIIQESNKFVTFLGEAGYRDRVLPIIDFCDKHNDPELTNVLRECGL